MKKPKGMVDWHPVMQPFRNPNWKVQVHIYIYITLIIHIYIWYMYNIFNLKLITKHGPVTHLFELFESPHPLAPPKTVSRPVTPWKFVGPSFDRDCFPAASRRSASRWYAPSASEGRCLLVVDIFFLHFCTWKPQFDKQENQVPNHEMLHMYTVYIWYI